jgi:hypothetical protein
MAVEIVNSGKKIKFDCVDNWEFADDIYTSNKEISQLKGNAFEQFLNNIKPVSNIINYHKCNSYDAPEFYEDESLDFVFIDASHEYENVKKDIINWYPKVKFGGVIAGHDYTYPDVRQAVDEFFVGKSIESPEISWVHYKNK